MTTQEEYIKNFKNYFGYDPNYFPKRSFGKIADHLYDELKIKMPTDTAAREVEGDAVMLLVSSGDPDAEAAGKRLGNIMMRVHIDDDVLLSAMERAASKLEELEKFRGLNSYYRRHSNDF